MSSGSKISSWISFRLRTYRNWHVSCRDGDDGGDDRAVRTKSVGQGDGLRRTSGRSGGHAERASTSAGRDWWVLSRDTGSSRNWNISWEFSWVFSWELGRELGREFSRIFSWEFWGNSSASGNSSRNTGASGDPSSSWEREGDGLNRAIRWWF